MAYRVVLVDKITHRAFESVTRPSRDEAVRAVKELLSSYMEGGDRVVWGYDDRIDSVGLPNFAEILDEVGEAKNSRTNLTAGEHDR